MSPNKENALSRLLFAILKQKNLKDIDWDQVAADPVLLEPIPNGHAARMRFSRYRNSVTGHESSKRRSSSGDHNRIVKVKREPGSRKDGVIIKSESGVSLASLAQFSPLSNISPYLGETYDEFDTRFTTPSSDDLNSIAIHPSLSNHHAPENEFVYTTDYVHLAANDPNSLEQSPTTTFDDALNFSTAFTDPQSQPHAYPEPNGASASQGDYSNWGNPVHSGPLF